MTNIPKHHVEIEEKIIHLMLSHVDVVHEMADNHISVDFFSSKHKNIIDSIFGEAMDVAGYRRHLTLDTYRSLMLDRLGQQNKKNELLAELNTYRRCQLGVKSVTRDDLGNLRRQLVDNYISRQTSSFIKTYTEQFEKQGHGPSAKVLYDNLGNLLDVSDAKVAQTVWMDDAKDDFMGHLDSLKKDAGKHISCGIEEIDKPMTYGFKKGHLTLFAADVGNHKTNMLINVSLNIYLKKKVDVLYIPLEMEAMEVLQRIVANQSQVDLSKLSHPERLSKEETDKISKCMSWNKHDHRFAILDVNESITVSFIRRHIEKMASYFKPKIVVIDYLTILEPDVFHRGRNDLELGDIAKTLFMLGRKYGFHVISAVQLGRQAIRSMRDQGDNATLDSTALRGSHDLGAHATNVFAMEKVQDEQDKLRLYVIKSRHGLAGYKADLRVDPATCKICNLTDNLVDQSGWHDELNTPPSEIAEGLEKATAPSVPRIEFSGLDDLSTLGD